MKHALVIPSAGNTAAAFAQGCSTNDVPCVLIIPESALSSLHFNHDLAPCVKLIALTGDADYLDAIRLAERLARLPGYQLEGGVFNVARRDGLATVLLSAVEAIGHLPSLYFQAIGSGAGAIGVFEAAVRLSPDYGALPQLVLSQNLPFTPISDAWNSPSRTWSTLDPSEAKKRISLMSARVLANRSPPYAVAGGLFDTLTATCGTVKAITNKEAADAAIRFQLTEGIDIGPPAAVAVASLIQTCMHSDISRDATILLNITEGGPHQAKSTHSAPIKLPDLFLDIRHSGCFSRLCAFLTSN